MSDFLSKFSGDQYEDLIKKGKKEQEAESSLVKPDPLLETPELVTAQTQTPDVSETVIKDDLDKNFKPQETSYRAFEPENVSLHQQEIRRPNVITTSQEEVGSQQNGKEPILTQQHELEENIEAPSLGRQMRSEQRVEEQVSRRQEFKEVVEVDPSYRRKKRIKIIVASVIGLIVIAAIVFGVYQWKHVEIPDFEGKMVTDARTWGAKHKIEIVLDQQYDLKAPPNQIISQEVKVGKKVKKGSQVKMVSSLGPDPKEIIALPDFKTFTYRKASEWIEEQKADNLSIVRQFNDEIEMDKFIKLEISDSSIQVSEYKREDRATLYFSKGPEKLEKNIEVPDFSQKLKNEVEAWAKKNEINMTYTEAADNEIEVGMVISQSIAANEKVAKKDEMAVVLSLGKAVTVPNFGNMTAELAGAEKDLVVTVQQKYSERVFYGRLISQSIPAGTKLSGKDDKNITLVYSLGTPYLKDLRYNTNEGDLEKYVFEEFLSKGARVTYYIEYVLSEHPKGTIVNQYPRSQSVPLDFTVTFWVSMEGIEKTTVADTETTNEDVTASQNTTESTSGSTKAVTTKTE